MRSLISVAVAFICLSNLTGVWGTRLLSQENMYLTKLGSNQVTLQHQLTKRQATGESAPTLEDTASCTAQLSDILCTSGIIQRLIEADLSCGMNGVEQAQKDANTCAKSEDGQYCRSQLELYGITQNYVEGNCSMALSQNDCPSTCRTLLVEFKNKLGCCINAHINGSTILSSVYSSTLNYSLWELCGVSLPPQDCGNGPTISTPNSVQNCTSEDLFNRYYAQNLCLPQQRQLYTDAFKRLSTDMCDSQIITPDYVKDLCSLNTNGVPCGILYYQSSAELSSLNSACSTSCSSDCRERISAVMDRSGCCLSSVWFNSSYRVLESCDIEPPRKCNAVIGSAMSIMKKKFIILVIAGLLLSYLLI